MKIKFNRLQLFILLVLLNLILISGIIYAWTLINNNSITYYGDDSASVVPVLSKTNVTAASKAFIVYDRDARVVVAGKNENLRFSPASTAKIMTAILSIEAYALDDVVTVGDISEVEGSKMNLIQGERITILNLLYGLMLPSGNDAAHVLADHYPGGLNAFVAKMNQKANELSMQNTKFSDPAGLLDSNYSTALDLARLASYATKNPNFAKIVSTKYIRVSDLSGTNLHDLNNLNELLGKDGVTGVKTGYTEEAGGVLVTSINHAGRIYIVVVLNTPDRFADTKNVIDEAISKIKLFFY